MNLRQKEKKTTSNSEEKLSESTLRNAEEALTESKEQSNTKDVKLIIKVGRNDMKKDAKGNH